MKICVGAVSRRVVEVAADMNVPEIIASRRQVDIGGGYTGFDQRGLVAEVRSRSEKTKVVRDHGGPHQSGIEDDDYVRSFKADIAAGFDWLHIDVCKLPSDQQADALCHIALQLDYPIEVGGEYDSHQHNMTLLAAAKPVGVPIRYCVLQTGAKIHADQQVGWPNYAIVASARAIRDAGTFTKAHNQDWSPHRRTFYQHIDACNIAPEFARVETEAMLDMMTSENAMYLLNYAYQSGVWTRWFESGEGTWRDRAVCAVRYVLEEDEVQSITSLDQEQESYVRDRIRDAILRG